MLEEVVALLLVLIVDVISVVLDVKLDEVVVEELVEATLDDETRGPKLNRVNLFGPPHIWVVSPSQVISHNASPSGAGAPPLSSALPQ